MTTFQLTAIYTHGLRGLIGAYALALFGMGLAHVQRRAPLFEPYRLPLRAAKLCALGLLSWAIGRSYLDPVVRWGASSSACVGALYLTTLAYVGGLLSLRDKQTLRNERGAQLRNACRSPIQRGVLQLAGINISTADEAKHFKLLGTTGTGKSTAIRELLARRSRAATAPSSPIRTAATCSLPRCAARGSDPESLRPPRPDGSCLASSSGLRRRAARPLAHPRSRRRLRTRVEELRAQRCSVAVTRQAHAPGTDLALLYRLLQCPGQGTARTGGWYGGPAISRIQQCPHVRCDPLGAERRGRHARSRRHADRPPLSVRRWVRCGTGVLFLPYSAGQIAALRSLSRLAADRHLRDHEPTGRRPTAVVRRR